MTYPSGQPADMASAQPYACGGCGARVEFAPGTGALRCPYCGYQAQIAPETRQIRMMPYGELATVPRQPVGSLAPYTYVCQGCGGQSQFTETATLCQFCKAPVVLDVAATGQIAPEA